MRVEVAGLTEDVTHGCSARGANLIPSVRRLNKRFSSIDLPQACVSFGAWNGAAPRQRAEEDIDLRKLRYGGN